MKILDILNEAGQNWTKRVWDQQLAQQVMQEILSWSQGEDNHLSSLSDPAEDLIMDVYGHEMPYGYQTGDDGTPDEWIFDYLDTNGPQQFFAELQQEIKKNINAKKEITVSRPLYDKDRARVNEPYHQ